MVACSRLLDYSQKLSDPKRPGKMIILTDPKNQEVVAPNAEQTNRHSALFSQQVSRGTRMLMRRWERTQQGGNSSDGN